LEGGSALSDGALSDCRGFCSKPVLPEKGQVLAGTASPLDMMLLKQVHEKTLQGQGTLEVSSSSAKELAQAFAGRVQFPVAVADLLKEGSESGRGQQDGNAGRFG